MKVVHQLKGVAYLPKSDKSPPEHFNLAKIHTVALEMVHSNLGNERHIVFPTTLVESEKVYNQYVPFTLLIHGRNSTQRRK